MNMIYFRKGGGIVMGRGISGRRNNVYKCPVAGVSMAPKGG